MAEQLLNLGFGNYAVLARIVCIAQPQSSPMRRLREDAAKEGRLIDATEGRRTRALVILDSNHVILSAIQPDTLKQRFSQEESD